MLALSLKSLKEYQDSKENLLLYLKLVQSIENALYLITHYKLE